MKNPECDDQPFSSKWVDLRTERFVSFRSERAPTDKHQKSIIQVGGRGEFKC